MKRKLLLLALLTTTFITNSSAITLADSDPATLIFQENFDAFTEGTETAPDTKDISTTPTILNNKLSQVLSGWKGKFVYEAGGKLKIADSGNLQTKSYDMSANGGIVKITIDVKSINDYGGIIKCAIGYNLAEQMIIPDGNWHTISFVMDKGNYSSYLKIEPFLCEGILVDNLKVETSALFLKAPKANQPSIANQEYFMATWGKVTGATGYLLDVYSKKADNSKEYLLQNEAVTSTSKKVEGLSLGKTYYYTVRAQKGEAISDPSNEIEVVEVITSVDAPIVSAATNITEQGFTANWEKNEKAAYYQVYLTRNEILAEDTEMTCLFEDFSGIKTGTISSPEIPAKMQEYLDAYTKLPGWYTVLHCFANGYIGLSPYGTTAATLTTPALNLSNNDGIHSIIIKMGEFYLGTSYEGTVVKVNLYNGDDKVETVPVTLKKELADYTLNFTKGSAESYIEIEYSNSKKLLIDEITVKQPMKAGDIFKTLSEKQETESTNYAFCVTGKTGVTYSYQVQAFVRTVVQGEINFLASPLSEPMTVAIPTNIKNEYTNEQPIVYTTNGQLIIKLSKAEKIEVYSTDGQLITLKNGQPGVNVIDLQDKFYIVRIGNTSMKVVL